MQDTAMKDTSDIITLEQAKATDYSISDSALVYIYSREHHAYWRPDAHGHTKDRGEAGVWRMREAYQKTRRCGPEKKIEFHRRRQTYSTGSGPVCPGCDTEYYADDEAYYDEDGMKEECPDCGVMLHIQPYISTSWTTTVVDDG